MNHTFNMKQKDFDLYKQQLRELAHHNIFVHEALDLHKHGKCTWEQAMTICVVHLAKHVDTMQAEAVELAKMQSPASIRMGVSKKHFDKAHAKSEG